MNGDSTEQRDPWAPPPGEAASHPGSPGQGPGFGAPGSGAPYGPAVPGPYPPPGYPAVPAPWGVHGWGGPRLPTGLSVASLVVGLISLALLTTFWGAFLVVLSGPVAIGLGASARRRCDQGLLGDRGKATAGFVTGIVATAGAVLMIGTLVAMIVLVSSHGGAGRSEDDAPVFDARAAAVTVVR